MSSMALPITIFYFLIFLFTQLARCQDIAVVSAPSVMQIGETYTISWTGGDPTTDSYVYISSQLSAIPVLISTPTVKGNDFSWTPSSIYPSTSGYSIGVSQSALLGSGIVWSQKFALSNAAVPSAAATTLPAPEATFTSPLINPSSVLTSDMPPSPTTMTTSSTPSSSVTTLPTGISVPQAGSRMSSGAIAGISVGVVAVVALIGAIGFLIGRRLSQRSRNSGVIGPGFIPQNSFAVASEFDKKGRPSYGDDVPMVGGHEDAGDFPLRRTGQDELPPSLRIGRQDAVSELPSPVVQRREMPTSAPVELPFGGRAELP